MSRKKISVVLERIERAECSAGEIQATTGFDLNFIRKTVARAEREGLILMAAKRKTFSGGIEKVWRSTKSKPEPRPVDVLRRTPWEAACHFA